MQAFRDGNHPGTPIYFIGYLILLITGNQVKDFVEINSVIKQIYKIITVANDPNVPGINFALPRPNIVTNK